MVLGHEGAGVVEEVGPGVTRVAPGDHIVCSFIPSCGTCHWCATGQQAICDWGANTMRGYLPGEHWPLSGTAPAATARCACSARSASTGSSTSTPRCASSPTSRSRSPRSSAAACRPAGARRSTPPTSAPATRRRYGVGGIGINAVQGARFAGAQYGHRRRPGAFKRETALKLGATHAVADAEEAHEPRPGAHPRRRRRQGDRHHRHVTAEIVDEGLRPRSASRAPSCSPRWAGSPTAPSSCPARSPRCGRRR